MSELPCATLQPLNCDRDAVRWAREFNDRLKEIYGLAPLDEGWLVVWFANAMMCGEDTYRWRQEAKSLPSAKVSPSDPMAGRLEILAKRLKDCDYADRGTIQCGAAGNANLVRYNGEDIVGCAHVYDERDRLLLGWLAENAQRILDALSARSATTPTSEALAALRELVALKGMKDELERTEPRDLSSPRNYAAEALRENYESRKPAAWDRARAVVHAADSRSDK